MQDIDNIIARMGEMLYSEDIESDPNGMEKFIALHRELLHESGYEIKETFCKCCGQKVDQPENEVRLEFKDKTLHVIYVCPVCNVETELDTKNKALPTNNPEYN